MWAFAVTVVKATSSGWRTDVKKRIFRQIAAQVSSKSRETPPLYSLHREEKKAKRPSMLVKGTTSYLPVVIENIG